MGKLSLKLLGPPEVRHGGRSVRFRAREVVALLAYLAAEGGSRHRDEIIELLWPGSDEAHGRALLRRALSSLRETLGESVEPSANPISSVSDERAFQMRGLTSSSTSRAIACLPCEDISVRRTSCT
jgi:two-component SAPR family response regulator